MPGLGERAAGGVLWRWRPGGDDVEVLIVHRPHHDDWSLPKGKHEPGEDDRTCALREVVEETGLHGLLGVDLGVVRYRIAEDRMKTVRWWAMTVASGQLRPNEEVDALRWVPLAEAPSLVSYDSDRLVLTRFVALQATAAP